jgi:hypothetical protein
LLFKRIHGQYRPGDIPGLRFQGGDFQEPKRSRIYLTRGCSNTMDNDCGQIRKLILNW